MNPIMAYVELKSIIAEAWADQRVVPLTPPRRRPGRPSPGEPVEALPDRDSVSGWSFYTAYRDVHGVTTERRVTCIRLWRVVGGRSLQVTGFCHECGGIRRFDLDRMTELVDVETGELMDPPQYFGGLQERGLPFGDEGVEALAKVLVFLMRCDGEEHPAEWEAIERALTTYALRYGGDDTDLARAISMCRPLAPDSTDLALALRKFLIAPVEVRKAVADLVGRACADVVDADGRLCAAEMHWGGAVDRCLRLIRR